MIECFLHTMSRKFVSARACPRLCSHTLGNQWKDHAQTQNDADVELNYFWNLKMPDFSDFITNGWASCRWELLLLQSRNFPGYWRKWVTRSQQSALRPHEDANSQNRHTCRGRLMSRVLAGWVVSSTATTTTRRTWLRKAARCYCAAKNTKARLTADTKWTCENRTCPMSLLSVVLFAIFFFFWNPTTDICNWKGKITFRCVHIYKCTSQHISRTRQRSRDNKRKSKWSDNRETLFGISPNLFEKSRKWTLFDVLRSFCPTSVAGWKLHQRNIQEIPYPWCVNTRAHLFRPSWSVFHFFFLEDQNRCKIKATTVNSKLIIFVSPGQFVPDAQ